MEGELVCVAGFLRWRPEACLRRNQFERFSALRRGSAERNHYGQRSDRSESPAQQQERAHSVWNGHSELLSRTGDLRALMPFLFRLQCLELQGIMICDGEARNQSEFYEWGSGAADPQAA
jgi:hypothetical protein